MKRSVAPLASCIIILSLTACTMDTPRTATFQPLSDQAASTSEMITEDKPTHTFDLSVINKAFRFSLAVPNGWQAEYVSATQAINLYDPRSNGLDNLEKSQVFIRQFTANDFLTLSTVKIYSSEQTIVGDHPAVRYEIEKKPEVPVFAGQPYWRSQRHRLVDIRFAETNPSIFYVIAYSPELAGEIFEDIIDSIVFDNDRLAWHQPLARASERVTKKPFARLISSVDSPVQPERFSGYHTGVDYEVFPEEKNQMIEVMAVCSGPLIQKNQSNGYGGVAVQSCQTDDQIVSVVYGHLALDSIKHQVGDYLIGEQIIGRLGYDMSEETDYERQHFHLGIHKGSAIDVRGYVSKKNELNAWINPSIIINN